MILSRNPPETQYADTGEAMIERAVLVKLKEAFTAANERRDIAHHSRQTLAVTAAP